MLLDRIRISVSVATAEFKPERDGTRLVFTEQGAFLDGHEMPARREQGMGSLLDSLGQWLQSGRSTAAERPTGGRAPGTTTSSRNYERNGASTLRREKERMAGAIGRVRPDATPV
jgi:hypothetical protein